MSYDVSWIPLDGALVTEVELNDTFGASLNALKGRDVVPITIMAGVNDTLDWTRGGARVATVPPGTYSGTTIAAELSSLMLAQDPTGLYANSFNALSHQLVFTGGLSFALQFATGPNAATSIGPSIGYTTDRFASLSHLPNQALAGIVTARDVLVLAASFDVESSVAELLHDYTASASGLGSEFRFVGENADTPSIFANGQIVRVTQLVSERDGGTEERLAHFEAKRVASGSGRLGISVYRDGVDGAQSAVTPQPILIDENNNVWIGMEPAGTAYALNVRGPLRAPSFKQGGSDIGVWEQPFLDLKSFDGDAILSGATGQMLGGNESNPPWQTDSDEMIEDLNVPKLRGFGWPSEMAPIATATPVPVPPDGELHDLLSYTAPRQGNYLLFSEATAPVISGSSQWLGLNLPGPGTYGGTENTRFGSGSAGETGQPKNLAKVFLAQGEVIKVRARNLGPAPMSVSASLLPRWLSNGLTARATSFPSPFAMGTSTAVVT